MSGCGRRPVFARQRARASIGSGVQFGAAMYLTLLPATAFNAVMRWAGLRTLDWTDTVPTVVLALRSGAALAVLRARFHHQEDL